MQRITCFLVVMSILAPVAAQSNDDPAADVEVDPERIVVDVAPVAAVVDGLPPLPMLDFEESEPDGSEVVVDTLPQEELAPPDFPRETLSALPTSPGGEQVYFNATLGGGSVNSVLGNINVYRLGEGLQFRLGYDHRGSDGFNFNELGTGYFSQENSLETWVQMGTEDSLQLEIEGSYGDRRFGLQGLPTYYSADSRTLEGTADLSYQWSPRTEAGIRVDARDEQRVLAARSPDEGEGSPREIYRMLRPVVRGRLEWPRFHVEARGDYEGRFAVDSDVASSSMVGLELAVEGVPMEGLTLFAQGATRYRFSDGAFFPVQGGFDYRGSERWGLRVEGGYRVSERSPADMWNEYIVSDWSGPEAEEIPLAETFFTQGTLDLQLIPALVDLSTEFTWERQEDAFRVGAYDEDPTIAGYPITTGAFERLDGELESTISLGERTSLSVGWLSRFEDRRLGFARDELFSSVEIEGDTVSGSVSGTVPFNPSVTLPVISTELRYRVAEDVEFRAFGRDLLGPAEEDGRTPRGVAPGEDDPFVAPGFEIGVALRVSF
ncbi:MAG: hypothetical protein R6U25_04910 [Alkalispirochaeta sp.]